MLAVGITKYCFLTPLPLNHSILILSSTQHPAAKITDRIVVP